MGEAIQTQRQAWEAITAAFAKYTMVPSDCNRWELDNAANAFQSAYMATLTVDEARKFNQEYGLGGSKLLGGK